MVIDTEDVEVKPMTQGFRIICEDSEAERLASVEVVKKNETLVKKLVKIISSAKLKHSVAYTNADYWLTMDVQYPLQFCLDAIKRTTSSVETYSWKTPKKVDFVHERSQATKGVSHYRINVEIPEDVFGKRDHMNVTYPAKRAHYLCSVAHLLKNVELDEIKKIEFVAGGPKSDDILFPDLRIETAQTIIRITLSGHLSVKVNRFKPTFSNLRLSKVFGTAVEKEEEIATPNYNQRLARSLSEFAFRNTYEKSLEKKTVISTASNLVARLLQNRGLEKFADLVLAFKVQKLEKDGVITDKQEILTVIREIVKSFVEWDIAEVEQLSDEDVDAVSYKKAFDVTCLAEDNVWNVASDITKDDIARLKSELTAVRTSIGDVYTFDSIFVDKTSFFVQYDQYFRLKLSRQQLIKKVTTLGIDAADDQDLYNNFIKNFLKTVKTAMGERIEYAAVRKLPVAEKKWPTDALCPNLKEEVFLIAFRVNREWNNPLTVGPPAQTEEAKEFRDFWKGKSELRKFADTRICECMTWDTTSSGDVPLKIMKFLLSRMYGLPETAISWRSQEIPKATVGDTTAASQAFANLGATLRALKDLPLTITNVHGISPFIRGTEPIPSTMATFGLGKIIDDHYVPSEDVFSKFTPSVTVHITLEMSGKWGNEVEAIRRLTSAFYIQLAKSLRTQNYTAVPTMDQLFVIQDGIVFKLVIVQDRMLQVLEKAVNELRDAKMPRIESSLQGLRLTAWKKRFIIEPQIQQSLLSFSTSHRVYAETVRIFKLWLGSNQLSSALHDIIIELLVVAAIKGKGSVEPSSALTAFSRTLELVSSHNWLGRPLLVDLGDRWDEEKVEELETSFIKARPVLAPMVVITNEDTVGTKFTRENPTPIVLKRLTSLAAGTLRVLELNVTSEKPIDIEESLFREDFSAYDAVIHLHSDAVVRRPEVVGIPQSNKKKKNRKTTLPVVEFDPIDELTYQLNNNFHHVAMFFFNKYGGAKIGIVFKPKELEVPAKITRCNLHKSLDDARLGLNKEEIAEGIRVLGKGIVKSVVFR